MSIEMKIKYFMYGFIEYYVLGFLFCELFNDIFLKMLIDY